jgi:hypothetical protein
MVNCHSYDIPIIDPEDTSCWASVREFFDGYFYGGPERFVIIRDSSNVELGEKVEVQRSDHTASTILKVCLAFLVVPPVIGAGCYLYNWCSLRGKKIRVIDMGKYVRINDVEQGRVSLPRTFADPSEKNLSFQEYREKKIPNITRLGDYTNQHWDTLIQDYRNYRADDQEFLFQMLLLKRDLLNWKSDLAERRPIVRLNSYVPEFEQSPIEQLIPTVMLARLQQERDMVETLDNLVQNRLVYLLKRGEERGLAVHLRSHLTFLQKLNPHLQFAIHEVIVKNANRKQLAVIAAVLQKDCLNTYYVRFLEALLQSNELFVDRADGLSTVFAQFWAVWETEVPLSEKLGYKPSLWVYLLAFISIDDLQAILPTVSQTSAKTVTKLTIDFLALRRHEDPTAVKKRLLPLLKSIPETSPYA